VNIVVISRLTFRKGVDLLVDVVPTICKRFPQVYFIIGGDGPKKKIIEESIKKHGLTDRVEMVENPINLSLDLFQDIRSEKYLFVVISSLIHL
jgi:glycosyltransferase involved in cell wall biosynthesis